MRGYALPEERHAPGVGVRESECEEVLLALLGSVEGEGEGEDVVAAVAGGTVVVDLCTNRKEETFTNLSFCAQ